MTLDKPEILLAGPQRPLVDAALAPRFTVHRLWEAPDREKMLAEVAPRVKAIVSSGGLRMDAALMDRMPALEMIVNISVGYDLVDAVHAGKVGITVTNTPDVLTEEVADLTVALLLATLRELPKADAFLRSGQWLKGEFPLSPGTMRGRSVGIVGLGRIGKAVARRIEGFGVPIAYFGRNRQPDVPYRYVPDLISLAREVDTLVSLAPGGAATRNMVGREVFEALGPQGVFVNCGRGSTVDEAALADALRSGAILAAGLDVFADEPRVPQALVDCPNAVLLPHIASASVATRDAMAELAMKNLLAWHEGGAPPTPLKEAPWPPKRMGGAA